MAEEQENKNKITQKANQEAEKQKKKLKKRVIKASIPYIAIILVILMLASAVYALLSGVVDLIKNLGQSIVDLFTVDENGIVLTDEQLDQLIASIESSGIDLEDLELLR